jgi:TM2 domain-containing membrane protein YozV
VEECKNLVVEETVGRECISTHEASVPFSDPYLYVDKKSRTVYVILAILLGQIGIHNFYAGYIGRGVVQLLISVLSFGLLFWISWIWAIIEICVVKMDGRSIPFD